MMSWQRDIRRAAIGLALTSVLFGAAASAHLRGGDGAPAEGGIAVAELTHGQMAVIADHRRAILALAEAHPRPDPALAQLAIYAAIQYASCWWGLMPGSLADEESPFNECAHAYLAATQAVLLHMQGAQEAGGPAHALAMRIEADMLANNASLVLCRFSGQGFTTAAVISPRWGEMLLHWPTLASLFGLMLASAGILLLLLRSWPDDAVGE